MAKPKTSSSIKVGTEVTYVPNGVDYGSRPKNTPVPALVISSATEQEFSTKEGEKKTRNRYNLIVFQDKDTCTERKVRVPHKDDALEGESFFE